MKLFKSKFFRNIAFGIFGFFLASIAYGLLQLIEPVAITPITNSLAGFSGRALLIASDADMVASAYADAKLERVAGIEDTLTAIELPLNPKNPQVGRVQVSNSVMSWPQIIATSPDRKRAYVVEVRSRPADGIQQFQTIEEMPPGEKLTVVDISEPRAPKVIESVAVGKNPEHISISLDGRFLAVNLEEKGRELLIAQLQPDGRVGKRFYFPICDRDGDYGNGAVVWHPSGQFLAMTQDNDRKVGFYKVEIDSQKVVTVKPYGQTIEAGNHLSNGRFTDDGRFFLVPDLKWRTQGNFRAGNFLFNPKGEMIAIRFDETGKQAEIVFRSEVGLSPEGFALSPDNSLIATVNMRRTYFSPDLPPAWRGKNYSSLSLVKFDKNSGQLTTVGEYGFEGLLPEQATFDAEGKSLAVVIYNYREKNPRTGAVEFWNVVRGDRPRLERTGFKIDVVRGAHNITLVR